MCGHTVQVRMLVEDYLETLLRSTSCLLRLLLLTVYLRLALVQLQLPDQAGIAVFPFLLITSLLPGDVQNLNFRFNFVLKILQPKDCSWVKSTAHAVVGWYRGEDFCTVYLLPSPKAPNDYVAHENTCGRIIFYPT